MSGKMTPAQLAVLERIQHKKLLQQKKTKKRGQTVEETTPVAVATSEDVRTESAVTRSSRKRRADCGQPNVQETDEISSRRAIDVSTVHSKNHPNAVVPETPVGGVLKKKLSEKKLRTEKEASEDTFDANSTLTPAQVAVLEKIKNRDLTSKAVKSRKSMKQPGKTAHISNASKEGTATTNRSERVSSECTKDPGATGYSGTGETGELGSESHSSAGIGSQYRKGRRSSRKPASEAIPSVTQLPRKSSRLVPFNTDEEGVAPKFPDRDSAINASIDSKIVIDPSDDSDHLESSVHEVRLRRAEIRAVINRIKKLNGRFAESMLRKLNSKGVIPAFNENLELTSEQNSLVLKYRSELNKLLKENIDEPGAVITVESSSGESDAEVVSLTTTPRTSKDQPEATPAIPKKEQRSHENLPEPMDVEATHSPDCGRTILIFDTNAYLVILPYCRALLDSDSLRGSQDYEDLSMFMLFVVINELDGLSKRGHKKSAMAAIKLVHSALRDKNPHIEGQDLASSQVTLAGSTLNDDYILKSADIVRSRGDRVLVVTDDQNLRVKISMMQIDSLNCLEFVHRFHWLTPLITRTLKREIFSCGEEMIFIMTERVVASVFLKGLMAHLAPLPMDERRALFPSEKLSTTLALSLKHKKLLQSRTGPFAVLSYDLVHRTLSSINALNEPDAADRPKRLQNFANFTQNAASLCNSVAQYFPNMESRAKLVSAVFDYFKSNLPEEERNMTQNFRGYHRNPQLNPKELLEDTRVEQLARTEESPIEERQPSIHFTASKVPITPAKPTHSREPTHTGSRAKSLFASGPPRLLPEEKSRITRTTVNSSQKVKANLDSSNSDSIFFAFSRGNENTLCEREHEFQPIKPPTDLSRPYQIVSPPRRPIDLPNPSSPYQACQTELRGEALEQAYEFLQKLGLSICNYTGSCCVKSGVKFPLSFQVSAMNLHGSIHEVTENFSLLLKAMKLLIVGTDTLQPADDFLRHSSKLLDIIRNTDPVLVAPSSPIISVSWLCSFAKNVDGKKNLVAGYQQFCDFNNCLEKCWLQMQQV